MGGGGHGGPGGERAGAGAPVGAGEGERRGALLAQAEEAYRCAVRSLRIACGPSHPLTNIAAARLARAIQEHALGFCNEAWQAGSADAVAASKQAVMQEQQQQGSGGKKAKPFTWLKKKK